MTIGTAIERVGCNYKNAQTNLLSEAHAWDICHLRFENALTGANKPDMDYLCLNLGMYLANWGMYRGSSFIRNFNYREYKAIVDVILKPQYAGLLNIEFEDYIDPTCGGKNRDLLEQLSEEIREQLLVLRNTISKDVKNGISQTLITKILLVTLGCVPAYDQYFCTGIKTVGISAAYNSRSIEQLAKFYGQYKAQLDPERKNLLNSEDHNTIYPEAKVLDMIFFDIGFNS